MKTLIVYGTKHGSTGDVARRLAERIGDTDLYDLIGGNPPNLDPYGRVILGSPLMAGMVRKEVKAYAQANGAELLTKEVGLFVCGLQDQGDAPFTANFSPAMVKHAKAKGYLGGTFDPEKCGFAERMAMRAIAKQKTYATTTTDEGIARFAREVTA